MDFRAYLERGPFQETLILTRISALGAMLISVSAHAGVPCTHDDYKLINFALTQGRVQDGAHLQNELIGVLQEELGPVCLKVLRRNPPGPSIPGLKRFEYTLEASGDRDYAVTITRSFDGRDVRAYLTKP